MRNITIAALSFLITFAIGLAARAQATNSVILNLTPKNFQVSGDDLAQVDLLKELKKQNPAGPVEIQMLRLKAKTGVGGAQFFLRVNGQIPDSQSLETDPDQFDGDDMSNAGNIELRNTIRADISEATLLIQGFSNTKISAVEVVMGAVTEVAILGHYADQQVQIIGGNADANDATVVKPTEEALANIQSRYYALPATPAPSAGPANPPMIPLTPNARSYAWAPKSANPVANQLAQTLKDAAAQARGENPQQIQASVPPVVPAPVTPVASPASSAASVSKSAAPAALPTLSGKTATKNPTQSKHQERAAVAATKAAPPVPPARCVANQRGDRICVGDKVQNRWGFAGVVKDIQDQNGEIMAFVQFGFGDTKWRDVDSISK